MQLLGARRARACAGRRGNYAEVIAQESRLVDGLLRFLDRGTLRRLSSSHLLPGDHVGEAASSQAGEYSGSARSALRVM